MKSYFILPLYIEKTEISYLEEHWEKGCAPVEYKDYKGEQKISINSSRRNNFPSGVYPYLYGDADKRTRFYRTVSKEYNNYGFKISNIQLLLMDSDLCVENRIPAQVSLEVEYYDSLSCLDNYSNFVRHLTEDNNGINGYNIYKIIDDNKLIPGFSLKDFKDFELNMIEPSVFVVTITNIYEAMNKSLNTSPKDIKNLKEFYRYIHRIATGKLPSYEAQKKWDIEAPNGLWILGEGDWSVYVRSKGICYYIPDGSKMSEPARGYVESFHLDGIMFTLLKENIIKYYRNYIARLFNPKLKLYNTVNINKNIHEIYIAYNMGRNIPRGGQHVGVMNMVFKSRNVQDDIDDILDSVGKLETINSSERQEKLAKIGIVIAVIMVVPSIFAMIADGISIFNFITESFGWVEKPKFSLDGKEAIFDPSPSIRNIWTGIFSIGIVPAIIIFFFILRKKLFDFIKKLL